MVRFSRMIAAKLIPYVKKIDIRANYWDPNAVSAFEFARQMMSDRLKKANPTLEVELFRHDTEEPAKIHVEFADGTVWDTNTYPIKAVDLRNEVFLRAEDCEDTLEDLEIGMKSINDLLASRFVVSSNISRFLL
jgi:hypothetical protein